MAYTPEFRRWAIIHTWNTCHSIPVTAQQLHLSKRVVRRWVKRYLETGTAGVKPKTGRRHLLSASAMDTALQLLLDDSVGGAKNVAQELQRQGITEHVVSQKTIIRSARLAAKTSGVKIRALRGKPAKMLSAATKKKRLKFCKEHLNMSFCHVMFTDRKKFPFTYPGTKVHPVSWVQEGQRRQAAQVNHAQCVNVYAGITKFGMTKLHVVAGTSQHQTTFHNKQGDVARNITSDEYRHVLETTLLPEGRRIFGAQGVSSWVLQQDNDPAHRVAAATILQYNERHGTNISLLPEWPPSSPDLSLIENVWAHLQRRMDARGCKSFMEYKAALHEEARMISQERASTLFASMGKRLRSCIEMLGDKTKY